MYSYFTDIHVQVLARGVIPGGDGVGVYGEVMDRAGALDEGPQSAERQKR